jgi:pimeloyl-ACP methyl ester carboxylesterase
MGKAWTALIVVAMILFGFWNWQWPTGERLVWGNCWFKVELPGISARCGHYFTGDRMAGQAVVLPVVVLSHSRKLDRGPTVVHIGGGPGAPVELDDWGIQYWMSEFLTLKWPGDLVLYDQRGVGLARPAVQCDSWYRALEMILSQPLSVAEEGALSLAAVRACLDKLAAEGIDLATLTTRRNVTDLKGLIDAMELDTVALYGVSYGTRVAMQAAREFPERISAMVLDSAYPPQYDPIEWYGRLYVHALNQYLDACVDGWRRSKAIQDPAVNLERLVAEFNTEPMSLLASKPHGGRMTVSMTGARLLNAAYFSMYWMDELLPQALVWPTDRSRHQFSKLTEQYLQWMLDENFNIPVYWAVDCSDIAPAAERDLLPSGVTWIDQYVESLAEYEVCDVISQPPESAEWRAPVSTDIPTLFLVGALDPVTPPIWSFEAAAGFSRSRVAVIPAIGHAVTRDACAAGLARTFLRQPDKVTELDEC